MSAPSGTPKTNWDRAMVACYHPLATRYMIHPNWEKCPSCLHVRYKENDEDTFWRPATKPPWWLSPPR